MDDRRRRFVGSCMTIGMTMYKVALVALRSRNGVIIVKTVTKISALAPRELINIVLGLTLWSL
jgi:hypothetical protein